MACLRSSRRRSITCRSAAAIWQAQRRRRKPPLTGSGATSPQRGQVQVAASQLSKSRWRMARGTGSSLDGCGIAVSPSGNGLDQVLQGCRPRFGRRRGEDVLDLLRTSLEQGPIRICRGRRAGVTWARSGAGQTLESRLFHVGRDDSPLFGAAGEHRLLFAFEPAPEEGQRHRLSTPIARWIIQILAGRVGLPQEGKMWAGLILSNQTCKRLRRGQPQDGGHFLGQLCQVLGRLDQCGGSIGVSCRSFDFSLKREQAARAALRLRMLLLFPFFFCFLFPSSFLFSRVLPGCCKLFPGMRGRTGRRGAEVIGQGRRWWSRIAGARGLGERLPLEPAPQEIVAVATITVALEQLSSF